MRNERAAPVFNTDRPRELPRFFEDLEQLMERAHIKASADMKKQVVRYVDFETEQVWKTIPEFKDANATYDQYKAAIMVHYPDASGDYVYSIRDMDMLIGERQRVGISSAKDLSEYHLQFTAITSWLIDKEQLSKLEQQRAYIRVFQTPLLNAISNRLQLKNPDHHPNLPYKVSEVYDAARFILQGALPTSYTTSTQAVSTPSPVIKSENVLKIEHLGPLMAEFTKTIVDALKGPSVSRYTRSYTEKIECIMCGGEHTIPNCDIVEDYIKAGKCKRNHENKVVLPSGSFVPRNTNGKWLCNRIDEWHRLHPNQLATINLQTIVEANTQSTSDTHDTANQTYTLSREERIATLQAELYNLSRGQDVPIAKRTRAQKAQAQATTEEEEDEQEVSTARQSIPRTDNTPEPSVPRHPTVSIPNIRPTAPEHPFRNARDAAYQPPVNRNVAVPEKPVKRPEPAYKTLPPVHDPKIATDVYARSMNAQITVTQRELLSLSPEYRSQVRDVVTTRRVANKDGNTAQNLLDTDEQDEYSAEQLLNTVYDTPSPYSVKHALHKTPPAGSLVITDAYEAYYKSLGNNEAPDPDQLFVAIESGAVRSIHALIDNSQRKECIMDPGCQIVSMSEITCHELGLAYDPSIVLHMVSANGNVNPSLGLARNVPFQIGSITFYMQVHVVRAASYEILLGRPFDILTESIVRNFANQDQTITIRDPNTGRRSTVPTLARTQKGHVCPHQHDKRNREDF